MTRKKIRVIETIIKASLKPETYWDPSSSVFWVSALPVLGSFGLVICVSGFSPFAFDREDASEMISDAGLGSICESVTP